MHFTLHTGNVRPKHGLPCGMMMRRRKHNREAGLYHPASLLSGNVFALLRLVILNQNKCLLILQFSGYGFASSTLTRVLGAFPL
jgi:hypothetical protein